MKRFLSAFAFCICLLIVLSFVLFPPVRAKEDPIAILLDLPAPPPPNPLVSPYRARDKDFYNKFKPPKDDAPIDELLEYWRTRSEGFNQLGGEVAPSEKTLDRIMREIEKDHKLLTAYVNILPDGDASERFVRGLVDGEGNSGIYDKDARDAIKAWMSYHTAAYSEELRQTAESVRDQDEYLTDQDALLALTRVDFAKAEPILNRLYNDSAQKTSQTLAKWALYRHAVDTNSLDVDKYRDELKAVVEDKGATPGMRDLALDALSKEKEWPGRDEWYLSLLSDETLSDLRVNGASYTGLTTMMYYVPDDRLTDKMLEMLKSDNKTVRANVIRNLLLKLDTGGIELVRAMVPWLEDPKWADDTANSRYTLVSKLSDYEIPESVPGLIKTLDEKRQSPTANSVYSTNTANSSYRYSANAANTVANAMATISNRATMAANSNSKYTTTYDPEMDDYARYPLRDLSIAALAKQKDPRAVPALRRVLGDVQYYQQTTVVRAMIECKGFTVAEELDGLELAAKSARSEMDGQPAADPLANLYRATNNITNANASYAVKRAPSAFELKAMVGRELVNLTEIPDELARAVVDRIAALDKSDKPLGEAMRRIAMKWQSPVINLLLLSDLKNGRSDSESILKLLSQRKAMREKQSTDIFDARTGSQTAVGISACLMEDQNDAAAMLEGSSTEAKTALLACSRLIRLPLPIDKVAANLTSQTPILASAAERYLESEDSAAARSIVLSRHQGEARVMGATSAFFVNGAADTSSEMLSVLYASLGDDSLNKGWYGSGNDEDIRVFEKSVQDEIKKTPDLIAMYAYDGNYIRIYKDNAIYSFDEDSSRYRERPLDKHEFDEIKAYIHDNKLDELPPFLNCGGEYCEAKELLMLGKNGGRRVYVNGDSQGIFDGLAKLFEGMKKAPATLRYSLSRDLKGLEILIASEDLHAETVWKDGADLKIAASQTAVRKRIDDEVAKISDEEDPSNGTAGVEERKQKLRDKHEYDGYGWYRVTPNGAEPGATQPAGVDIIPVRDGLAVQAGLARWMRRAPGFEIRASEEGLFKVVRGQMTKIRTGVYDSPIVTPNGRWVVVSKGDAATETGQSTIILDLVTNKERAVDIPNNVSMIASAYVPTINKVLLTPSQYYGDEEYSQAAPEDVVPDDAAPDSMILLDPATGAVQPIAGEFRPLDQQTFRPLQSTGRPNEFWAAIYDLERNVTEVGYYETKTFGFRPVLKVPKIKFNSMSMYVDEPANKVYFVYRGHLLSLPLETKPEAQPLPSPK